MLREALLAINCCLLALPTPGRGADPPAPGGHGENAVAFAPNGQWLVTGGSDAKVRIRDGATGVVIATLAGHRYDVYAVAVAADGRTIASASSDGSARLWDVERRAERRVLKIPPPPGEQRSCLLAVAFAPDGRTVATGDDNGTIQLWDVESGAVRQSWRADSDRVTQVLYSPDGATIASVGADPAVKLWDARTQALRRSLPQPGKSRLHLAYAPDGATLAVSRNFDITLWDTKTGAEKDHLRNCPNPSPALAFTPDGDYLAVAGIDLTHLCVVKPRAAGDDRWSVIHATPEVSICSDLAVSPDGRLVAHCFSLLGTKIPSQSFKLVAIR